MKQRSERGSYTLEALIALVAFIVVIMAAYSFVKTMIAESIMQRAVSNISAQISTYVYVIDRAGLIVQHSDDEFSGANNAISQGASTVQQAKNTVNSITNANFDQMSELVTTLFGDGDDSLKGVANSFKQFVEVAKSVDWAETAKDTGKLAVENLVKSGANAVLENIYDSMLDDFLPADRETFCRMYNIDIDSVSFEHSAIFPTNDNDSIFVAVEYTVKPQFNFPGLSDRTIIKCAFNAAWVSSNANGDGVKSEN